jgi:3-deoxy-D-manno-octulosonate 8-phosphate phosphatase (KDO 8-P phosphatase)
MIEQLTDELRRRLANIRLLVMDCDGVLTDGQLYYTASGESMKVFDVKDGQGIASWHAAGFRSAIISGRPGNGVLQQRAKELKIDLVNDSSTDKAEDLRSILNMTEVDALEAAFIGDDIGDLPAFAIAGVSFSVADGVDEARSAADIVTVAAGGRGAVREVVDLLLAARADLGDQ